MTKFALLTAAAFALAFAAAPASAEMNYGPVKNGNQCWKGSPNHTAGSNGGTWGYWDACPTAAGATAHVIHRRHHAHS